jgi:hypothetical protein
MPRLQPLSSQTCLPTYHESPSESSARTHTSTRLRGTGFSMNLAVRAKESTVCKSSIKSVSIGAQSPLIRRATTGQVLPSHRPGDEKTREKSPLIRFQSYRASEKGKGDILPTTISRSKSAMLESPIREGYATDSGWNRHNLKEPGRAGFDAIAQKLRSRRRTSSTEDLRKHNMTNESSHHSYIPRKEFSAGEGYDYNQSNNKYGLTQFSLKQSQWMRKRGWLQIFVAIAITFLVFDSYNKATKTSERLDTYQQNENRMMLHLQRIEQHSRYLHESMTSLSDVADMVVNPGSKTTPQDNPVDTNLIRVQAQQLQEMEQELDHELRALQSKIQNIGRSAIVREFGEGPVQVSLELSFPDGKIEPASRNVITILLWYDTPHAAWTWLQQIGRGEWNGAPFSNIKGGTIDVNPMIGNTGSLDFIEKAQKSHEPWTVGLRDLGSSLGMFINLQDNTAALQRDVCVGKVIDGFETLQRLVDTTRKTNTRRPVTIRNATASHSHQTASASVHSVA